MCKAETGIMPGLDREGLELVLAAALERTVLGCPHALRAALVCMGDGGHETWLWRFVARLAPELAELEGALAAAIPSLRGKPAEFAAILGAGLISGGWRLLGDMAAGLPGASRKVAIFIANEIAARKAETAADAA